MQLLGKNYYVSENTEEKTITDEDGMYTEDGLEVLCDTLEGERHHRIPGWMSAAGNAVRENSRHLVVAASVLVIGFAVYLNWAMYNTPQTHGENGSGTQDVSFSADAVMGNTEDMISDNTGTASAVSGAADGADDYFAVSQINRQRARDEAIAVLQDVVDGAENLSDVQSDALAGIAQIAADIEHEAAIESLVKGKGFEACVAVISGETANVIVKSSALLPNEVAQIQEIVYETSGIVPANVKIIEK